MAHVYLGNKPPHPAHVLADKLWNFYRGNLSSLQRFLETAPIYFTDFTEVN